jgi:hypothetical protein
LSGLENSPARFARFETLADARLIQGPDILLPVTRELRFYLPCYLALTSVPPLICFPLVL